MLPITLPSMHDQLKSTTVTEAEQALMAKLLVVDDEKNIRVNLAKFLESCGHQVESAEGGPQALAILAGQGAKSIRRKLCGSARRRESALRNRFRINA
jgi:PleD family two-component response regulator